jgi:glycosyltransferase involved in cell wall biosynthesis
VGPNLRLQPQPLRPVEPLYLGLPPEGEHFGWGLCSKYLARELAKRRDVRLLGQEDGTAASQELDGVALHGLTGVDFEKVYPTARGRKNFAYTFFENELSPRSKENALGFELVMGGSTWCKERMEEKGISNCGVLLQGIDPERFHPVTQPKSPNTFVLFSGGKFELRKGQDLVIKAIGVLQSKYPDIILVNCWYNFWPDSMDTMASSPYIRYERKGRGWTEIMEHIFRINGLDTSRIFTVELIPNGSMREFFAQTDLGVFPNRCEGGTNLMLMEYMACGKPVIASNTSGHRDIVNEGNAVLLNHLRNIDLRDPQGHVVARWQDPSLDELIERIEWCYHNRNPIQALGCLAGEDLAQFTWERSATRLLELMDLNETQMAITSLEGIHP